MLFWFVPYVCVYFTLEGICAISLIQKHVNKCLQTSQCSPCFTVSTSREDAAAFDMKKIDWRFEVPSFYLKSYS